jgi:polysaccharide export outer membrane protein
MNGLRSGARTLATSLAFVTAAHGAALAETPIRAGDHLSVVVYNHPDLSSAVVVTSDGDLSLPVVGEIHVEGLGSAAAAERIRVALARVMRSPSVVVRVTGQGQSLFFTGAVVGTLPFTPGESLVSAIGDFLAKSGPSPAAAGAGPGPSSMIDLRSVGVKRGQNDLGTFDIETLGRSGHPGPTLEPGDLVTLVDKPVRVDVRGDVKSPGPVYLYRGETLAQAVDQAGAFSATTSLSQIVLHRDGTDRTVSSAGAEFTGPAMDGDVLTLRPAPHVDVYGMVTTPGEIVLKNDRSLLSALYAAGGPTHYADLRHVEVVSNGAVRYVDVAALTHGDLHVNASLADGDVVFVPEGHKIDLLPVLETFGAIRSLL